MQLQEEIKDHLLQYAVIIRAPEHNAVWSAWTGYMYMHASSTALKSLDTVYHSALRFITGDKFLTHHCILYEKVSWPSLRARREEHCLLFIYKALLGQLPLYLSSLLTHTDGRYTLTVSL